MKLAKSVCIVTGSYKSGGAEKVAIYLANYMADSGRDVTLVVILNEGSYRDLISPNVNVIDLNSKRVRYAALSLHKVLRSLSPEIVISTQRHVNLLVGPIAKLSCKGKIIFREATTFDAISERNLLHRFMAKLLITITYLFSSKIIANSEYTKYDLEKNIAGVKSKTTVIANPVLNEYSIDRSSKGDAPHQWLNGNNSTFLGVGRLHPLKDFQTLIRAFKLVTNVHPNSKLLIIGEGEEKNRLEVLISSLSLESSVELLGYRSDLPQFFSRSTAFCMTSKWEGFGNVLVEAGANNCPLIVAKAPGGSAEIIEGGKHARLFSVGNELELSKEMITAIELPPRKELLVKISAKFKQRYSVASIIELYEQNIDA